MIVVMIVAFCVRAVRRFPFDVMLLLVFILCFSYIVSFSCSALAASTDQPIVPIAIAATVAICLSLTGYAFLCKGQWVLWRSLLLMLTAVAVVMGISLFLVQMSLLVLIFWLLGVLIYGIYLVVMSKMIMGG